MADLKSLIFKFLIGSLVAVALVAAAYFYWQYRQEKLKNPQYELENILKQVNKYYQLPTESPTLATVTEKEKLLEQGVFSQAENGDKVLIFPERGLAILYRPSANKIIDVVPVQSTGTNQEPTELVQPESDNLDPATLLILNGSPTVGITENYAQAITSLFSDQIEVSDRLNANSPNYTESMVIVLNEDYRLLAEEIAKQYQFKFTTALPESEAKSSDSIVIILGSDYVQTLNNVYVPNKTESSSENQ